MVTTPTWQAELSELLAAMRDVHGALIELQAREVRLFAAVDHVARRAIADKGLPPDDVQDPDA